MRWEGADNVVEVWNSLLAFGDEVLTERFSAVDDLVSRVLGGGVANRYETRLTPTVKWLMKREPDALSAFFLHAARWDREQAAKTETTSRQRSNRQPRPPCPGSPRRTAQTRQALLQQRTGNYAQG